MSVVAEKMWRQWRVGAWHALAVGMQLVLALVPAGCF